MAGEGVALRHCLGLFDLSIEDLFVIKRNKEKTDPDVLSKFAKFLSWLSRHFISFTSEDGKKDCNDEDFAFRMNVFVSLVRLAPQGRCIGFGGVVNQIEEELDHDGSISSRVISIAIGRLTKRYEDSSKGVSPSKMREFVQNLIIVYAVFRYLKSFFYPLRSINEIEESEKKKLILKMIALINALLEGAGLSTSLFKG